MTAKPKMKIKSDERTITVRIPIVIRRRGGKKLVLAPDGKTAPSFGRRIDDALVKALARAFRWRDLLENGTYRPVSVVQLNAWVFALMSAFRGKADVLSSL